MRNFDNIQFEKLRRNIDNYFNQAHDKLETDYRAGNLTKVKFDTLHGLLWNIYDFVFHKQNLKQVATDIIPEEKYNQIINPDNKIVITKDEQAITFLKAQKLVDLRAIATRLKNENLDIADLKTRLSQDGINLGV